MWVALLFVELIAWNSNGLYQVCFERVLETGFSHRPNFHDRIAPAVKGIGAGGRIGILRLTFFVDIFMVYLI